MAFPRESMEFDFNYTVLSRYCMKTLAFLWNSEVPIAKVWEGVQFNGLRIEMKDEKTNIFSWEKHLLIYEYS